MAFREHYKTEENENSPFKIACMASLAVGVLYTACMLSVGMAAFTAVAAGLTLAAIGLMVTALLTCCWYCGQGANSSVMVVNDPAGTPFEPRRSLHYYFPAPQRKGSLPQFSSGGSRDGYSGHFHTEGSTGLNHVPAVCLAEPSRSRVPATPTYDPRFTPGGARPVDVASPELSMGGSVVHGHR